jgi:DNA repair exonuclease SbcCD ATPase subunit
MQQILAREKGIDLLFLDEVFESLCKENIEVVSRLISQVSDNKSIFLITHLDNLGALRNAGTWCLNYNNGLTTLQDGR